MFKNYSNCTCCIYAPICQYKSILKEIYNKMGGYWDNLAAPDIFKLELECEAYEVDEKIKNNNPFS